MLLRVAVFKIKRTPRESSSHKHSERAVVPKVTLASANVCNCSSKKSTGLNA